MTFLHYSHRVKYITTEKNQAMIDRCNEIHRMLNGLISSIKARL